MKDNVIPFPVRPKPWSDDGAVVAGVEEKASERQLDELRHAFDEARKLWPLELSELPEQNRICATSRKR